MAGLAVGLVPGANDPMYGPAVRRKRFRRVGG